MSDLLKCAQTLRRLAVTAKVSADDYIKCLDLYAEEQEIQSASRSASVEDKAKIDTFLKQLNGSASLSKKTHRDILIEAGVRVNQGTSSYARHHLNQLRLTYKSQEA